MKVLFVLGTRPEAIKLAPVIQLLSRNATQVDCQVCLSGQHAHMARQMLSVFGIEPDYDLAVMRENQRLAYVFSAVLSGVDQLLSDRRPDWVLVQGDTTTAAAAALAGFYNGVGVGHVEAGLRTADRQVPFPEEVNRRSISVTADLHFAPTDGARDNLLKEGVSASRIYVTGNTAIDALLWMARKATPVLPWLSAALVPSKRLVLVTTHRRESFGEPLRGICHGLLQIADRFSDSVQLLVPVHRNPVVSSTVRSLLGGHPAITLTEPLDYPTLVEVLKRSYMVITDSGGLQEECPALGVPVLVLRNHTERPEGISAGVATLVGTRPEVIVAVASRLLESRDEHSRMVSHGSPFGDGAAAPRIAAALGLTLPAEGA